MKYALIVLFVFLSVLPARAERIAIAVLDLDAKGVGLSQGVADALTETVRYEFAKQESIDLVAREKMRELAKEKAFQLTGCTDVACAVQIGKALNVQKMVMGSVTKQGEKHALFLRIVDVEKENVECNEKEDVDEGIENIDATARILITRVTNNMWVKAGREAVQQKSNDPTAHTTLGWALWKADKVEEAEKEIREALRLKPDLCDAIIMLGGILGSQGKIKEAEQQLRDAITLNPNSSWAHRNLSRALFEQGRLEAAEKECREVIRLEPGSSMAHLLLGVILKAQKKSNEEIEVEYRKAIRLDQDNDEAHYQLGQFLSEELRHEEAETEFRKALRLAPNRPDAHYGLGSTLYVKGQDKEAELELRATLRFNSRFGPAHYLLGMILTSQAKFAEAEMEFRTALRLQPDDPDFNTSFAFWLDAANRRKEARPYWEKALKVEKEPSALERIKKRLKEKD